jgi:threonine aldolase
MIDLRSDTVTQPCQAMREAMVNAPVGDDVIDRDPTVDRLQKMIAEMLGKEAALFMPSGSMTNQIAVRMHCLPGDEFLCEEECHIYNYEQAAFAQLSGVVARTIPGHYGVLRPEQLRDKIRPDNEHMARTKMVALENTHNRGGGTVWPIDQMNAICQWAHQSGLTTHLDGARLFNAEAASGIDVRQWCEHFDSVSVCFSKGLGAPVGSALAGSNEFIQRARRGRKLFGGGMRQSGILAAGAIYGLEHNRSKLVDDHAKAQHLAKTISKIEGFELQPETVDTNIVIFSIDPRFGTAQEFANALHAAGVYALPFGPQQVRLVTHLDVSLQEVDEACQIISATADSKSESSADSHGQLSASRS